MSGPYGYPMGQQQPPQNTGTYPHNYPMGTAPPPGQPGSAVPPPGQPGYGIPPPGHPGYGPPPPGQPGFGPPGQPGFGPPGQPGFGPPPPQNPGYGPTPGHPNYAPPGYMPPGVGVPAGPPGAPYGVPPPAYGTGYAPPGATAPYPPGGHPYPAGPPSGIHSTGDDSDDSQPGDPGLRSRHSTKKIKCTFVNNSGTKVVVSYIDERGKLHKVCKLKDGKKEVVDTFEGHVFLARGKRRKKRRRSFVINNNVLYAVTAEEHGDNRVKAEIIEGPDCSEDLESEKGEVPVMVKFINRSKRTVQLVWINKKGKREKKKVVRPGRCFKTKSYECHYWIAHDVHSEDDELFLNYGFFYSPWKTKNKKERVLITDHKPWKDSSSSSSSSD